MTPPSFQLASQRVHVPLRFGPSERWLFGWFHPPRGASRATGVVLCNPIGDDYVRAHRSFRHLAEQLSEAGFAVLRFDFHGTGDSSGVESDPGRVAAWRKDVELAASELRRRSGAKHIALVGLRLGATIAMVAAPDAIPDMGGVESLVLWSPYLKGTAFVTESTKLHQMHKLLEPRSFASEPPGWDAEREEALGFLITPETKAALGTIDLGAVTKQPAARVLLVGVSNVPAPADESFLAHLRSLGTATDYRHIPGQKFLVQINHQSDLPLPIMNAIVSWLSAQHAVDANRVAANDVAVVAGNDEGGEEPIVFGDRHPLFGILHRAPSALRDAKRPAIIMTNAGCVHRIGPHRFYVPMARRWAALGFDVFRIDLSGIGDSPAALGQPENVTYPKDGVADIEQAMATLTKTVGAQQFIVLGLCSGGDLAFQLGFHDQRIAGAVMMNPRTFCVNDLEMVESYKRARYYQDSLFRLESWKKALRGGVDFRRALGMVVPKVKGIVQRRLESVRARFLRQPDEAQINDVPACLRLMADRGVDTLLVASEKDPGVDFVDVQFGHEMESLRGVHGFRREDFFGTDHTFTSLFAQHKVSDMLTEHFTTRHLR